ncbi:MAG: outer membrane protein assembly factor BamA [Roseovarius sp.]|uniref:outer membrane protein assembly factor BamA n=1 Tax=Roseobacteraceae TaxID=2854170 RepID=UPI0032ED7011
MNVLNAWRDVRQARFSLKSFVARGLIVFAIVLASFAAPEDASAQTYRFTSVSIEGNQRIEPGTILTYAGISRGQTVSAGQLNEAYQRIVDSGLFETVEIEPRGSTLVIKVREYPTINKIAFEGNRKIKDENLTSIVQSKSRQVFSPSQAERDASNISQAYVENGRVAARVTPKIIRRSDNRVDLVFEIFEGKGIEIQRVSFVGNKVYSDRRLRRVVGSKQAGLLRAIISNDTFVENRLQFDEQVLTDFYQSRGYVDFRVTGTNAELARERDGYFVTFNIQEGQQFRFGRITTTSEIPEANSAEFQNVLKIKPGVVYSPTLVENSIARMERLAIKKGIDFLRVEPNITRNDRALTLDVEFRLVRGPRVFVERIDIEGNTTTLDRVIRRQFDTVEGDPFNPREIRESAERIRALGYFSDAEVNAREGSRPDQVVVDVDVEETTTGSLTFGGSYSTDAGLGISVGFRERNFLGRGQTLAATVALSGDRSNYSINFVEPAFLGRDVAFSFSSAYVETDGDNSLYDTTYANFRPGITFPLAERSRLTLYYSAAYSDLGNYTGASPTLAAEAALGGQFASAIGYRYVFDSRDTGLNPNAGVLIDTGLEYAGLGGDQEYLKSTLRVVGETRVLNEEVTLRGIFEAGSIDFMGGTRGRAVDRFTQKVIRGFEPNGMGPIQSGEHLGGNLFAAAKFEAEFPLGLPAEFGITGGAFYDVGSIWNVDTVVPPVAQSVGFEARHVIGLSLFWESPFGPIRMDFSKALQKEPGDIERQFDFSVRTDF